MESWGYFAIEIAAAVFGFICVWLTVKQNVWCWPTGLVQVSLYIIIFYHAKLYSDLILHVIYVALGIYGWWKWTLGAGAKMELPVRRLRVPGFLGWIAVGAAGTAGMGYAMASRTDASLPYWDAFTTSFSLCAQALLSWKVLESWVFWIAVDVVAIGIYLVKGLYPTTGLYALFLILASKGLLEWRKDYKGREPAPA